MSLRKIEVGNYHEEQSWRQRHPAAAAGGIIPLWFPYAAWCLNSFHTPLNVYVTVYVGCPPEQAESERCLAPGTMTVFCQQVAFRRLCNSCMKHAIHDKIAFLLIFMGCLMHSGQAAWFSLPPDDSSFWPVTRVAISTYLEVFSLSSSFPSGPLLSCPDASSIAIRPPPAAGVCRTFCCPKVLSSWWRGRERSASPLLQWIDLNLTIYSFPPRYSKSIPSLLFFSPISPLPILSLPLFSHLIQDQDCSLILRERTNRLLIVDFIRLEFSVSKLQLFFLLISIPLSPVLSLSPRHTVRKRLGFSLLFSFSSGETSYSPRLIDSFIHKICSVPVVTLVVISKRDRGRKRPEPDF